MNSEETRNELRNEKIQENSKNYNLRRREPNSYQINDLAAIKRTQFGPSI